MTEARHLLYSEVMQLVGHHIIKIHAIIVEAYAAQASDCVTNQESQRTIQALIHRASDLPDRDSDIEVAVFDVLIEADGLQHVSYGLLHGILVRKKRVLIVWHAVRVANRGCYVDISIAIEIENNWVVPRVSELWLRLSIGWRVSISRSVVILSVCHDRQRDGVVQSCSPLQCIKINDSASSSHQLHCTT